MTFRHPSRFCMWFSSTVRNLLPAHGTTKRNTIKELYLEIHTRACSLERCAGARLQHVRTGFYQEIFGRPLARSLSDIGKRIETAYLADDLPSVLRGLLDQTFAELHMGTVPLALESARRSMEMAQQIGRSKDLCEAQLWYAMCQHFSNDLSVTTSFEDLATSLEQNELGVFVPVATILAARESTRIGDRSRAALLTQKAVAAMRVTDDPYVHAFVARTAALICMQQGNVTNAIELTEESIDVARLSGLAIQEARSLTAAGSAYLSVRKVKESLTALLMALDVYESLESDDWYVASTYRSLATLHEKSRDFDAAAPFAQRAYELFCLCGDLDEAAHALIILGAIAQANSNNEDALEHYRRAEEIFAERDSRHTMASLALSKSGEIELQRGNLESAFPLILAANERARRNESIEGQVHSLSLLGLLYDIEAFSNYDEHAAETYFSEAVQLDTRSTSPDVGLREALVAFHKHHGRYDVALALTEELHHLYTTVRDDTLQRRIAQVEARKQIDAAKALADLERQRNADLRLAQAKLIESEKMASLGQLTAGIAHEINNPVTFIASSIGPLRRDLQDLAATDAIGPLADELRAEISALLDGIEHGARRTAEIVKGLRIFSRLDEGSMKKADLILGIESTITILRSKLGPNITLELDLAQLPMVECRPGEINQVFLNILANAIDAVEKTANPSITVSAQPLPAGFVTIRISDNGPGIPDDVRARLFEPFFTTKDVGKGTGLGLSISYGIIDRHHGRIDVAVNNGAAFSIVLPIQQPVSST